jgi:hypothetical protein
MPDPLKRLAAIERGTTPAEALEVFDSLPALLVESIIGTWRGGEVPTGHVFDGLLGPSGWYGKTFRSADDVDPLIFARRDGRRFAGNPAMMPLPLIQRFPGLAKHPLSAALFRAVAPLLATRRARARLRLTEFRGVSSATMIYDDLPINDVFRRVDDNTVLGAMDIRGCDLPFFFTLRREEP